VIFRYINPLIIQDHLIASIHSLMGSKSLTALAP
jgi:hypothetical protein